MRFRASLFFAALGVTSSSHQLSSVLGSRVDPRSSRGAVRERSRSAPRERSPAVTPPSCARRRRRSGCAEAVRTRVHCHVPVHSVHARTTCTSCTCVTPQRLPADGVLALSLRKRSNHTRPRALWHRLPRALGALQHARCGPHARLRACGPAFRRKIVGGIISRDSYSRQHIHYSKPS